MKELLVMAILGVALLGNSIMARGEEQNEQNVEATTSDAAREFIKQHGLLNCTEALPEGAGQSEICKQTELFKPQFPERKEVTTWKI